MEFTDFHKWVCREIGIDLTAYKPEQLNRRITSLMGRIGVSSLKEYSELLKENQEQRQRFLDFITINVTEFFRNPELFKEVEKIIEKELIPKNNNLKIWSAACSIGCEPYSFSIILDKLSKRGGHKILATDIDNTILKKANLGIYTSDEVKNVKKEDLDKYFEKVDDKYHIDNSIKSRVTFKKHDLIRESYEDNFDLIICRNVVIYFNNDVKTEIYNKLSASLKPGGFLFVGATESIYDYRKFGLEKASTFIYRKL